MYKKGTGNDKQRKDAGNRRLYPYREIESFAHTRESREIEGFARTGNVQKGTGNDKQRKDAGNQRLCPYVGIAGNRRLCPYGQCTKKRLGKINKEKTREIEGFARIEILVRE